MSRELLARAWAAGAGPGDGPLTIDLDSTICETYGLAKEGARHHGYTGTRGYHPLLAIAAGTGDVFMSRLREGQANAAWLAIQVMAHNLARWTARIGLGERIVTTKTLRRRVFALAGRLTRSAHRLTLHLPKGWPWEEKVSRALARLRAIPLRAGWRPSATDPPSGQLNLPANSRHLAHHSLCRPSAVPPEAPQIALQLPVYPNSSPDHRACNSLTTLPLSSRRLSVSTGGFGLKFSRW